MKNFIDMLEVEGEIKGDPKSFDLSKCTDRVAVNGYGGN